MVAVLVRTNFKFKETKLVLNYHNSWIMSWGDLDASTPYPEGAELDTASGYSIYIV